MKENDVPNIINTIEQLEKATNGIMCDLKTYLKDANTIWTKCPFQINDVVVLVKTPEVTEHKAWGWLGSKHFLIKGARAVVKTREFYSGRFSFGLHFEEESWIDYHDGKKHLTDQKALYGFYEDWLQKVSEEVSLALEMNFT